ncbi:MAG: PQQ-like beta-propeller repeat protein [Planctomycetota bacterium]|nr:PQQ-like beta-propeller repeat protein [Planctomycetota bacterium]
MNRIERTSRTLTQLGLALGFVVLASELPHSAADDWTQFRGRDALGIADGQNLPDSWDVESGENIRWKTRIPGLGHACPIVSRGRVFIVTADSGNPDPELRLGLYGDFESVSEDKPQAWRVYCLSQASGRVLWWRTLHRGVPAIKRHAKASHANSTPVTDGERVVVLLGSEGLHCLDFCGRLLWRRDLGVLDSGYFAVPEAQWGFGSSPIIYDDMVILQCDVQKNSFLAAFDIHDGRELWRTPRADVPTWSTPTIVQGASRTELVVNGFKHAGGYDPSNGEPLWKLGGGGDIPVPTPVFAHNLIFLSSAHGSDRPLCAVRPGAGGDLTPPNDNTLDESLAWYKRRDGIYMQTPIVYGDYLYACRDNGVLSCYEARTGERLYQKRLGSGTGGFTASPVAADGKLYFTSEEGSIYIVAAGPEFKQVASNEMGASCMATPGISGGLLIVRTSDHVFAIGNPPVELVPVNQSRTSGRTPSMLQRLRSWRCRR